MNILLINIHSTHNAGDDVLLRVALAQLRQNFPDSHITLAMNDPASYGVAPDMEGEEVVVGSFTTWVKEGNRLANGGGWRAGALLWMPWWVVQALLVAWTYRATGRARFLPPNTLRHRERRALLLAYCRADLVVSSAGNFLYSSGRLALPLLLMLAAMAFALAAGKPLYLLPQTIGPLRRRWERAAVRGVLSRARLVLVRDEISLALLQALGLPSARLHLLPDIAFLFRTQNAQASAALLKTLPITLPSAIWQDGRDDDATRPLLGVTLINWGAQNERFDGQAAYEAAVAKAVRWFIQACNGSAVIFPQVHGPTAADDDRVPARRVAQQLSDLGERVQLVDAAVVPDVLKAAYARADFFIGSRLHSAIFALEAGVPSLAIAYQYKTHGILRMLAMSEWVIDIEAARGDAVVQLLQRGWAARTATRKQLSRTLPAIRREAEQAARWIHEDFVHLQRRGD